jgi:hypothetical protein
VVSEEKRFWVGISVFGTLSGSGLYVVFEHPVWGWLMIVSGVGGLVIGIVEGGSRIFPIQWGAWRKWAGYVIVGWSVSAIFMAGYLWRDLPPIQIFKPTEVTRKDLSPRQQPATESLPTKPNSLPRASPTKSLGKNNKQPTLLASANHVTPETPSQPSPGPSSAW